MLLPLSLVFGCSHNPISLGDGGGGDETDTGETDGGEPPAICGNGVVETGEFCDTGPQDTCHVCVVNEVGAGLTFVGERAGDESGYVVATADIDGDGRDDVIVTAPGNDDAGEDAGKTYVVTATTLDAHDAGTPFDLADATWTLVGEVAGDRSGAGLAAGGDYNFDGHGDLIIGAPAANGTVAPERGRVYLISGASLAAQPVGASLSLATASVIIDGEDSDRLGERIAWAGDVDGGGSDDFLLGMPGKHENGTSSGAVQLAVGEWLAGAAPGVLLESYRGSGYLFFGAEGDRLGWDPSPAGDVDGDGFADLLLGGPRNSEAATAGGRAYLVTGQTISTVWPHGSYAAWLYAHVTFSGSTGGAHVGQSLASAGDVDGDGLSDLLWSIGYDAPLDSSAGRSFLFLGGDLPVAPESATLDENDATYGFAGETLLDFSGASLSMTGDVDGDGLADVMISAHGSNEFATNAGKLSLFFASDLSPSPEDSLTSLGDASVTLLGPSADLFLGRVHATGDVDGDGHNDILASTPGADDDAGASYLVYSPY